MKAHHSMMRLLPAFVMVLVAILSLTEAKVLAAGRLWNLYQEGESSFRQANDLLQTDPARARLLFERAVLCFEAVHREGGIENGRLCYNIGNVYFRLGHMGKAILNYRRAERFIPHDLNLQQNLSYARSRLADRIEPKPETQVLRTIFFWHYDLGGTVRAWLLAAAAGFFWLAVGISLLLRRSWLRYLTVFYALVCLLLAGSVALDAYEQAYIHPGVILEGEVIGRKGDSTTFEPSFKEPLHMGVEFKLVEARQGWFHIELTDGRRCWIPASAAELI